MTLKKIKEKYPTFKYFSGLEIDEYVFSICDNLVYDKKLNGIRTTDIAITLKCNIKELVADENFLSWLSEQWESMS